MSQGYDAVLFDLDGTLLDTAPDLGRAANVALAQYGYPPISSLLASQVSSHGVAGLLGAALGARLDAVDILPMRRVLLQAYREAISIETRLFDGIDTLIHTLDDAGCPWGIVTNKPQWLTDPLLAQWPLFARSRCQISGDTLPHSKPHPAPMWAASEALAIAPDRILYVGDAERDMEAAQRAGMAGAVALWGYLRPEDQPQKWPGQHAADHPLDLIDLLSLVQG
ncbi:HAD-IA family hydrolase [Ferrimonas gelatinilytica]|uniref:HAD-IA family hydrolase n=1 Tax=Ferrimonas gelatinilytica TaxID=1255257 RepID=A0ABP9RWZ6_9GAMM